MTRRAGALISSLLLVAVAAGCGDDGGGGDEAAFCDELEALSDDVADGDLASEDGLEDLVDRANALIEVAADGEQADAVEAIGDELEGADPDDAEDTADLIRDELADIAEDVCDIDADEFALFEVATTTTTDTTEGPTTTDTTDGGGGGGELEGRSGPEVNGRQPVPADLEQEGDIPALAQGCFDGDPEACDELFFVTPVDGPGEAYGRSCGGRVAEGAAGQCAQLITGPVAVPDDVTDPNAEACFEGDMAACDEQFNDADEGSADQLYGGLCGGRVQNTTAFCVDIFGPEPFL
jgi:hypothetical protein